MDSGFFLKVGTGFPRHITGKKIQFVFLSKFPACIYGQERIPVLQGLPARVRSEQTSVDLAPARMHQAPRPTTDDQSSKAGG